MSEIIRKEFWRLVKRGRKKECWPWLGNIRNDGYGRLYMGTKSIGAHRASHVISNGDIPMGMIVCHKCDNPICCNPSHLWLGTPGQNTDDARKKGRLCSGVRNWLHGKGVFLSKMMKKARREKPEAFPRGERVNTAKLTAPQVIRIRARHKQGETGPSLALRFRVSKANISFIVLNKTWKHLL